MHLDNFLDRLEELTHDDQVKSPSIETIDQVKAFFMTLPNELLDAQVEQSVDNLGIVVTWGTYTEGYLQMVFRDGGVFPSFEYDQAVSLITARKLVEMLQFN